MNEEITASYRFDRDNLTTGLRRRFKVGARLSAVVIVGFAFLFSLPVIIKIGVYTFPSFTGMSLMPVAIWAVFFFLASILVRLLAEPLIRVILARRMKDHPSFGHVVRWSFSPQGAEMTHGDHAVPLAWGCVNRTCAFQDGILIFQCLPPNTFYWLPKAAFTSETGYQSSLALMASKTKHSKIS